ncbi:MAG: hypothetical protein K2V38_13235, partial [Gemmataceae bacterium]|nr:hypothetical protein [Gemmataceae bacterium]
AAECGLICLGMLLFSERTWKHHAVVLLLPFAALACALVAAGLTPRVRRFVIGALAVAGVLIAGPGFLAGRAADLALVYGAYTLAFALLAVATGAVLWCPEGRPCDLRRSGRKNGSPIPA